MRKLIIPALLFATALESGLRSSSQEAPAKPACRQAALSTMRQPASPRQLSTPPSGNMTCTLFPDKAPIGVQNFIGLATGTKDWKNPVSGRHQARRAALRWHHFSSRDCRVHDSGGRSQGRWDGRSRIQIQERGFLSTFCSTSPGVWPMPTPGRTPTAHNFLSPRWPRRTSTGTTPSSASVTTPASRSSRKSRTWRPTRSNDRPFRPVKIIHIKIVRGEAAPAAAKKPAAATTKTPPQFELIGFMQEQHLEFTLSEAEGGFRLA